MAAINKDTAALLRDMRKFCDRHGIAESTFGRNAVNDGKLISQSMPIARFIARENGLAGKDNWEAAKADMVVACLDDMITSEF